MSVTSTTNVIEEAGNGSKVAFDFNFKIFAETDLIVRKKLANNTYTNALVLNVDYTVSFDSDAETGTVTYTTAPVNGGASNIQRSMTQQQTATWPREGITPAATIENAVDKLTMMVQDVSAQVDEAVVTQIVDFRVGTFAGLDAAAGSASFLAQVTDLRTIMLYLGDRTLGNNGWTTLGGY